MSKFDYHDKINQLTQFQLKQEGQSCKDIVIHTNEELGEFCTVMAIEDGDITKKYKDMPKESSAEEAIDVAICALSLFYARGGTEDQFMDIIANKLNKWQNKIQEGLQS